MKFVINIMKLKSSNNTFDNKINEKIKEYPYKNWKLKEVTLKETVFDGETYYQRFWV